MIKVVDIYKSFGDLEVLKGIDLEFEPGLTNLIIGKSGAGKTVLLKILIGLITPTSGSVYYDETELYSLDKKELRELRMQVGMLFQGNALFDSMTVMENVRFPLDMFSDMSHKEKNERVNEVLDRVELTGNNDRYPSEISGGMQKRVGIARSIVQKPRYLFCDEPNSGLDPKTSILIDDLIRRITRENNITTVINTHDMNSVMEIGDKIALLHDGNLAWVGSKSEVLTSDNEVLEDFIFASPFLKKLKKGALNRMEQ